MVEIVVGTQNGAKVSHIKAILADIPVGICGLEGKKNIPVVAENGTTAMDNSKEKALVYSRWLGTPVLSTDHALYFDNLDDDQQPSLNVRRIPGSPQGVRPTDDQLLEYYSALIHSLGGTATGYWEFAVCIARPDGEFRERIFRSPRKFVETPCSTRIEGYPIDSMQVDENGRYYPELSSEERAVVDLQYFGDPLRVFVGKLLTDGFLQ